ncbi:MAG: hypothetical protein C4318_08820 [Acidimicrobiia bacterium]
MTEPKIRFISDVRVEEGILVHAFEGWTDSGLSASMALAYLKTKASAERFAEFLPDGLFDYRSRRPVYSVSNGISQGLAWPEVTLSAGYIASEHSVVTLGGPEPDINWQLFSQLVAEAATKLGIALAIGLGAIPAPVPHTKTPPIISTSPDPALVARVGALQGKAEVPAGIQLAIEAALAEHGIPSMCIWARVPHYLSQMAWPRASLSLLETVQRVTGFRLDLGELARSAAETGEKIDEAVRHNPEAREYVAQLERIFTDQEVEAQSPSVLSDFGSVTGDQIASEIEQFLASQDQNSGDQGAEPD